ncbi:alpha/beta hydrolase [Cellulomonas fimi]|uniref:Alpha/beta hydrolase n=1 Tax=Cellulomonas fimi TaxID=1708 RepID=A0A7Y0QGH5_CELFI|nr:alpha/beta hydrolase [Cellulomonas fimi]
MPTTTPARRGRLPTLARRAWWWLADYAYVTWWQVVGLVVPGGAQELRVPSGGVRPPVVLVPGVYESWRFMRPLARALHGHGHDVHVIQKLGFNRGTIPDMAALTTEHLAEADLRDVVVVGHSKGGLIGKYAMLRLDPEHRIRAMVTINTPFAGSPYARWVPLAAVRAFVPTDTVLAGLAAELEVNSRITSISSQFDPHIPGGSALDGATNVQLATPGHFRVLSDPALVPTILEVLEQARDA